MKAILAAGFLVFTFIFQACSQTNTNIVTITNNAGKVFKDIKIVRIQENGLIYTDATGGGKLKFDDLGDVDRKKYGLKADKAKAADEKEQAAKIKDEARRKLEAAEFQAKTRDFIQREQLKEKYKPQQITVIQKVTGGMLVKIAATGETCFLVHSPKESSVVDDDWFVGSAYPFGSYTYETVNKSQRTIRKCTGDLDEAVIYLNVNSP